MKCFECGEYARYRHHVVPRSLGGTKNIPLCTKCHAAAHGEKGHWTYPDLIRRAKQKQIEEGVFAGGRIPYGYKLVGKKITEDREQQRFISWMRRLQAKGVPMTILAIMLNAAKVPRSGRRKWCKGAVGRAIRGIHMQSFLKGESFRGGAN